MTPSAHIADPFGLVGQVLDGQFQVDAVIGEGGFSAVYRGVHLGLGEPIAIKCLKLTGFIRGSALVESFVQRFRDESRILYRLGQGNLNIVRCVASGTTMAQSTGSLVPYMVLEWLEGETLEAALVSHPRTRSFTEVMSLMEPVLGAIAHAHSLGVVHRDLSTSNIFLARQGPVTAGIQTTTTKVLDFGVAKVVTDDLALGPRAQTLAQIRILSPSYAAPEQFDTALAPPGPYTDVYSLGMIFVELLAGRPVRTSPNVGELMQHALEPSSPRTPRALGVNVPDPVEQVLSRALSYEVGKRQKDADELFRELRGALAIRPGRPPMDLAMTTKMPDPTPSAGGLFLAPAVAPGLPAPEPSVTSVAQPMPAVRTVPILRSTAPPPPKARSGMQWVVGLVVFFAVLGLGAVALHFLLLR